MLDLELYISGLFHFSSSLDVQLEISNFDYFDGVAFPHTFGDSSSGDAPAGSDQGPACKVTFFKEVNSILILRQSAF